MKTTARPFEFSGTARAARPAGHGALRSGLLFVLAFVAAHPHVARAADANFPVRPIRFVVPFPPGTATDVVARLVAQRLVDSLGQQVVVDNRAGASGTIGAETGARATPDGYTWVLGTTTTHALAAILNRRLGYDPVADFVPVTQLGEAPYFLTAHPGLPAADLREFIAWARANPGKALYASVGNLSLGHLTGELLKKTAGFDMTHVPYKGSNLALLDLLAGRIHLNVATILASLPSVRAGRLRAYGVTSRERASVLPQTPTVAESGYPGFQSALWVAVYLPARAPAATTARIGHEIRKVVGNAAFRDALAEQGFNAHSAGPAALAQLTREDAARWRKVISEAGLRQE